MDTNTVLGVGGLLLNTSGGGIMHFETNGTESFRITSADHLLEFITGVLAASGLGTVSSGSPPTGVANVSITEWLQVYDAGANVRYIPLYAFFSP
jgi:hypothetical protein